MVSKLWQDAQSGLLLGPLMVHNSFPLNIIALVLGYVTTHRVTNNGLTNR
jgi:hypothetical protein